ncbi:MAG TPA: hypothetical protein VFG51_02310 [Candidatus Saccharimonadia bacterium]|nr:hypothetical protein [Candidatus Saccharimonadia bacterium]
MKKEVVLAVVLGIIFGLVITFGIYTANKALKDRQPNATENTATQSPTPDTATTMTHIIDPIDGAIVADGTIRLTGTTFPNADVVIFVGSVDQVTTSDATGNFSAQLSLDGGSNVITTIVTTADGKQEHDQRVVVVSTANLDDVASPSAAARITTPTPKASPSPKASPKASATP